MATAQTCNDFYLWQLLIGWLVVGRPNSSELHLGNRLLHTLNKVMCDTYLVNHLWLQRESPQVKFVARIFSSLDG